MFFHDYRLVFHGSRSVLMVFHDSRLVFIVFHGSRLSVNGFSWFQVGFSFFILRKS